MYIPEKFELYEWLPKDFYNANINHYGDMLWLMFDERLLWTYDQLRKRYGRIILNDWFWGGNNQYRGWRPFDCPKGAKLSQHKWGRAGDSIFLRLAEEIRQDIMRNQNDDEFQYISVIEKDVSWLHIDCRNSSYNNKIMLI
jgi:hypothetical protein